MGRFAYADPPYLGLAVQFYGDVHPDAALYDTIEGHAALIERLESEFSDGWAMSLHMPSLRQILPLCPEDARVAAWVKGWCSWKPGNRVAYAREPIIWKSSRTRKEKAWTTRDWVMCNVTTGRKLRGAKPDAFCRWVFELLGMHPDDEFVDLFPGSGAVSAAWDDWRSQPELDLGTAAKQSAFPADGPAGARATASVGDEAGLTHDAAPSSTGTNSVETASDTDSAGAVTVLLRQGSRSAPAEISHNHQPECALCGLAARMWSGVEDWQDELGRWIGWCSKDHQRRWLKGERADDRRSNTFVRDVSEEG